MKLQIVLVLFATSSLQGIVPTACLISVAPHWQSVESSCKYEDEFCSKLMLVGSITFRKKSKEPMKLQTMRVAWHGKRIDHLDGSLYTKIPGKKFLPIEKNLVSDSSWNKARQELIFNFQDNPQTLGPASIFYLVLTVPNSIAQTLKGGHFSVVKQVLPQSFQRKAGSLKIDLAHLCSLQDRNLSPAA